MGNWANNWSWFGPVKATDVFARECFKFNASNCTCWERSLNIVDPQDFYIDPPITSHSADPAKYFPNPLGHSSQFMKKPMVRAYFPNILSSHCKCQIFRYRHHGSTRSLSGGSKRKVCLHELMVGVFNSCILQNSFVARLNQILPDWIAAILISKKSELLSLELEALSQLLLHQKMNGTSVADLRRRDFWFLNGCHWYSYDMLWHSYINFQWVS